MSMNGWLEILNVEFQGASDRACAIVAAALVDELLMNVLKPCLFRIRLLMTRCSMDPTHRCQV